MKKAIILDGDGVLLDSFSDQFSWFGHISSVLDKEFLYQDIEEFREDYREPVYPDMYEFLGLEWKKNKSLIWDEYNLYKANAKIELFPRVEEIVLKLNERYRLAMASSNTHEHITQHLGGNGLMGAFETIVAKEDLPLLDGEPKLKPYPDCLVLALDRLGCSPSKAVYVGDQTSDIVAARNVEAVLGEPLEVVGVTYGFASPKKIMDANPDYIIDEPWQLLDIL